MTGKAIIKLQSRDFGLYAVCFPDGRLFKGGLSASEARELADQINNPDNHTDIMDMTY